MISNAIGTERVSRITGYLLTGADFSEVSPNLPQRIAILGEANTASQGTMPTTGTQINSIKEAGEKFGWGSPIYNIMRILRPNGSDGVGGIPTIVYPQAEPGGSVAKEIEITVVGTTTASATHNIIVNGRSNMEGESYSFSFPSGETNDKIALLIANAINGVLGAPVTASASAGVVTLVSKWKGLTSDEINVSIETNDVAAGMTYSEATSVSGSGVPPVTTSLEEFQNEWNTIVLNSYGILAPAVMDELEAFNGKPDPTAPTGRFVGAIMKPFVALTGSLANLGATTDAVETDSRKDQQTIAICPAPGSKGLAMEAAANMAVLYARVSQDTPHLDVSGKTYADMPTPDGSILMSDYNQRDQYVKLGYSTVNIRSGKYEVQDFVTTYHPIGEAVPQYRFCRNLMIDFNIKFGYVLLEETNVVDHAIAEDNDVVSASKVIKPKQWIAILNSYAEGLAKRALISEPVFMQDSINVGLSSSNPDRLETFFRYKRSSFARILATTAEAGFNFGS
jgi:phage tail sheath gpL-like